MKQQLNVMAALLIAFMLPAAASAGQPAENQSAVPDGPMAARFSTFLTDVLAGQLPATGVFAKGSQPLMFVLDANGDIAGFFKD